MRGLGVALVALAFAAVASDAVAARSYVSGVACHPENNTVAAQISRSNFGVQNNSSSAAAAVWCPISNEYVTGTGGNLYTSIEVYDRHPSQNVDCTFFELDITGTVYWSWPRNSVGSGSSPQYLYINDTSGSNPLDFEYAWKCVIPPTSSGSISHVATYYFSIY